VKLIKELKNQKENAMERILNGEYDRYKEKVRLVGILPSGLPPKEHMTVRANISEGTLLKKNSRTDDESTLSVHILDQRVFTNGYTYQWSEPRFWIFEDKYSKDSG
jgi:hypothetical protein